MLALINALTALAFIGWLLVPAHVPGPGVVGFGGWRLGVARVSFCVVICVESIRLVQNFAVWVLASAMKDPVPKAPQRGLRIAMLTTIVPSKEPISVVERTLRAMRRVRYRGQVDVWILDEGDDPAVKAMAERLGVYHFSRKGIPRYNQATGPYRAKTKSGNHNAWRDSYERFYDVVAQMDPDHVALPCFLERTIGYFRDPDVAFVVAPQVYGPNHQHFFNVRLDMMVDGPSNTGYELNSEAVPPGPDNPYGNAWVVRATPLRRESEAQRLIDPLAARSWKIASAIETNTLGESTAYRLVPHDNVLPFFQPEAHAIRRAGFATRHLWVTAYDPAERFAAGDYPYQHPGGAGLPAYVSADRPLEGTDVVVWYTFGAHHVARPEDWPVMPVQYVGFHLQPTGFFDGNPALDVPAADPCHPVGDEKVSLA